MMIPQSFLPVNWLRRAVGAAWPNNSWPQLPVPEGALRPTIPLVRPGLSELARPGADLPGFVTECPVSRKYLELLGPLDWANFPERDPHRAWPGPTPIPRAPFVASFLVKLHEGKRYMSDLRLYLGEHPALVWVLGFPLVASDRFAWGFDVEASLPTARHFGRVLRSLPNEALQFLLDGTVHRLRQELPPDVRFGEAISLDTKHILAWVSAPCHARLHCLLRGCRLFAMPTRSPPLATKETAW